MNWFSPPIPSDQANRTIYITPGAGFCLMNGTWSSTFLFLQLSHNICDNCLLRSHVATPSYSYNSRETPERTWHCLGGICHKADNGRFTSTMYFNYRSPKHCLTFNQTSSPTVLLNAEWTDTDTPSVHQETRKLETPVRALQLILPYLKLKSIPSLVQIW